MLPFSFSLSVNKNMRFSRRERTGMTPDTASRCPDDRCYRAIIMTSSTETRLAHVPRKEKKKQKTKTNVIIIMEG